MEFIQMSAEEFRKRFTKNQGQEPEKPAWLTKNNKFHAEKTTVEQKTFDSKKEAQRYVNLRHLEDAGVISNLTCQKRFTLLAPFVYHGKKIRGIDYLADFCYIQDGQQIAEDVKSAITRKRPEYIMKKKLFMANYPDWIFREEI